jgi:hypothetical protein
MQSTPNTQRRLICEFIACLAVSWLFLQPTVFHSGLHVQIGIGVTADTEGFCNIVDHHAPAEGHHHHDQCALCATSGRDILLAALSLIVTAFYLSRRQIAAKPLSRLWWSNSATPPPIGWIASWSSRAPPAFS